MPKISIITPTYNSSLFIERTINSVLNQTITDWEYLIIDDGSKDNTIELIKNFTTKDSRIKLLKTPQNSGGPATPKNIGIENAKGEYVAFLDHDDEWLPEKLEKQLKVFEDSKDPNLGIVVCFVNIFDIESKKIIYRHRDFSVNALEKLMQYNFINTSSCVMTRTNIYKKIGFFDEKLKVSDDWDMWIRIIKNGYKLDIAPEFLLNYSIHKNNLGGNKEKELTDFIKISSKHKKDKIDMHKSFFLSYYYFRSKQYKLARKYYFINLTSKNINFRNKIKSFAYIIITLLPNIEPILKKLWRNIS